jgi:lipopolysaccharide transport system ATP-binding protein
MRWTTASETFWALKDVNMDVREGEVLGILGRNGAGKSTLLKILSRITEPTTGCIDVFGRVGSLLEVGTGFHPELTGRENIYLNGCLLGMRRKEISRQFDAIVAFAEVERFLDTPVKRYSSGMYVRLAFAVAAHLEPEILIIDEVLAVGDVAFQQKCLGKMKDVAGGGRTVLFVSHNMAAVRRLCGRAVLFDRGCVAASGNVDEIITRYLHAKQSNGDYHGRANPHGLELIDATLLDVRSGYCTQTALLDSDYVLELTIRARKRFADGGVVVRIFDEMGTLISSACAVEEGIGSIDFDGVHRVRFNIPRLQLLPGRYYVSVYVYRSNDGTKYLEAEDALTFEAQPTIVHEAPYAYTKHHGVVRIADGGSAGELDAECDANAVPVEPIARAAAPRRADLERELTPTVGRTATTP